MKDLSPIWFLESPIDTEHKYYILLDFLQSASREIRDNKIYSPLKKIFSLIEDLESFWRSRTIPQIDSRLNEEERRIFSGPFTQEETKEVASIVKSSLQILYKYADMGSNLWKNLEERIKIYSLKDSEELRTKGITIFRNMYTNRILAYWWKKTEIQIEGRTKKGIILKKVSLLNDYFSMSYEFILHEILVQLEIKEGSSFSCTVIEISEDFDQSSEIFKIAKEKFIKEIEDN